MFKENPAAKQHSLSDPYHGFPQYAKEALHKSWADEELIGALYFDDRPRPPA